MPLPDVLLPQRQSVPLTVQLAHGGGVQGAAKLQDAPVWSARLLREPGTALTAPAGLPPVIPRGVLLPGASEVTGGIN